MLKAISMPNMATAGERCSRPPEPSCALSGASVVTGCPVPGGPVRPPPGRTGTEPGRAPAVSYRPD